VVVVDATVPLAATAKPRNEMDAVDDAVRTYTRTGVVRSDKYGGVAAVSGTNTPPVNVPVPNREPFPAPAHNATPDGASNGVTAVVKFTVSAPGFDNAHPEIAWARAPNVDVSSRNWFRHAGSTKQNGPSPNTPA